LFSFIIEENPKSWFELDISWNSRLGFPQVTRYEIGYGDEYLVRISFNGEDNQAVIDRINPDHSYIKEDWPRILDDLARIFCKNFLGDGRSTNILLDQDSALPDFDRFLPFTGEVLADPPEIAVDQIYDPVSIVSGKG